MVNDVSGQQSQHCIPIRKVLYGLIDGDCDFNSVLNSKFYYASQY